MKDKKYLKLRHNVWYFQKRVPKALEELYPATTIIEESLETGDIREARQRRDIRLGQLQQQENLFREESQPKQRFTKYVAELTQIAKDPYIGEGITWCEVLDPETMNRTHDPEYVEAFKVVSRGETTSDKYGKTLRETLRHFIRISEREEHHTEDTRKRFEKTVKTFLVYFNTDDIQLQDIERSKVFDFIEHRLDSKSGATVQGDISRLKTLWLHAYSRAWVTGNNPFDSHKINTTRGREKRQPFTLNELKTILDVSQHESISMQLLILMGLYTGARISELVKIQIQDIKHDDVILMVGVAIHDKGKTSAATRWMPVPDQCLSLMSDVKAEATSKNSPYLFHDLITNKSGSEGKEAGRAFGKLKKRYVTSRSDKGFHSFRVMMATFLQQADVSELEASYLLGHSKKGLTMSYGYYSKGYDSKRLYEAQKRAGDVIDRILQE